MGVYSTETITRQEALSRIYAALEEASNEELGEVMFALFAEKTLNNFTVKSGAVRRVGSSPTEATISQLGNI